MALNPLALLFGQQSMVEAPTEDDSIVVVGQRPQIVRPVTEEPIFLPPEDAGAVQTRNVLTDSRAVPHPSQLEELIPREGMFGTKGTLRNILGVLGDAFLVQSGNDPMYAPRRQAERESDALFGFTQDPMQAIERLAVHNPQMAQEVLDAYRTQQLREATLASQEAARRSQIANREFDNREVGLNRISRWVAGGLPYDRILAGASRYGLSAEDLADLGITPDMTDEDRRLFASGDMTVNQTMNLPLRERQLDISQQNADSARINATRPRNPPPRPRADTQLEYYRQLSNIPESERTTEEKAFMKRYIEGTGGRGSRISGAPPPPPSTSNSPFRRLN